MKRPAKKADARPRRKPRGASAGGVAAQAQKHSSPASHQPVRIVVVDDHRFMRELISAMLARQSGRYKVIAEHGDATTAIEACKQLLPDLLILDINLPDLSGIDAVPQIKKLAPNTRILLCTAFVTDNRVVDALRSGADGFVEKTNTWTDFIEAIERVTRGEQFFRAQSCPALTEHASTSPARSAVPVPLSQREKEVLTLIATGDSTKEIATKLGVSIGTIETHRSNLMRKLNARNVADLVVYAFRTGLIKLSAGDQPTA